LAGNDLDIVTEGFHGSIEETAWISGAAKRVRTHRSYMSGRQFSNALSEALQSVESSGLSFVAEVFVLIQTGCELHLIPQAVDDVQFVLDQTCNLQMEAVRSQINGGEGICKRLIIHSSVSRSGNIGSNVATYAIGDVQGCFETFTRLLRRIVFDPDRDRLWFVGDLVNRGPASVDVLRWAKELEDRVTVVLGNHDFHLLARAEGLRIPKSSDTLQGILNAPDRDELLEWLAHRPLLYREGTHVLVHAGLLPGWDVVEAEALAREVEDVLRSSKRRELLERIYRGKGSTSWSDELEGMDRLRVIADAMTTLRTCTAGGRPCKDFSGPPELAPPGCLSWFDVPDRASRDVTVIFGHWAALGFRKQPGILGLDTGCVWGGYLTAVRLDDGVVFHERSAERKTQKQPQINANKRKSEKKGT
jgi:bis(5'-nucleosyl)-tetraphosphatase (symmetrical)